MDTYPIDPPPQDRLLKLTDLAELVGLGQTATKVLVRRKDFPAAVRLSQRTVRWWRSEVVAYLEAQRMTYRPKHAPRRTPRPEATDGPCPSTRRRGRPRRHD